MTKKNLLLAGLLVVLIAVAFLVLEQPGERSVTAGGGERVFELDSAAVDRIELRRPDQTIVLVKHGTEWRIESPIEDRADQGNVTSLIGQIKGLNLRAVVSSNPEKQTLFEVDSAGAGIAISTGGRALASLVVGKMGSTFSETYIRREGSNDVLLVDASLSPVRNRALKDWRNRTIVSVPRETIERVDFQYGDTTFALVKDDTVWRVGKQTVEEWTVSSLLSSLSEVRADDFVDVLPRPMPRVIALVRYGGHELRFAQPKGRDMYFVQSGAHERWYEMQDWRARQVLKRKKDLVKE